VTLWSRLIARLAPLGAAAAAGLLLVSSSGAARTQVFTASYSGSGSGYVASEKAVGVAEMSGRGRLIGRGTLKGSASGTVTSSACGTFSGRLTLRGAHGSLRLAAGDVHACSSDRAGSTVSFSGRARVVGGTRKFSGAGGVLSFSGTYERSTGAVSISFRGRIGY
jgi:hypothetical protein